MNQMGIRCNRPYKKSAGIVGEIIGKYHPHGDRAVYDTMVRMAQDFSMRYPLIDGQGNFGSIDGDPPAAIATPKRAWRGSPKRSCATSERNGRFHAELRRIAWKSRSSFRRVPDPAANGSAGIAVGMATNIPPHNLRELIDGAIALIETPTSPSTT